jgi:hypothetical protein
MWFDVLAVVLAVGGPAVVVVRLGRRRTDDAADAGFGQRLRDHLGDWLDAKNAGPVPKDPDDPPSSADSE